MVYVGNFGDLVDWVNQSPYDGEKRDVYLPSPPPPGGYLMDDSDVYLLDDSGDKLVNDGS